MKSAISLLAVMAAGVGCISSDSTRESNRVTVVRARSLTPLETDVAFAKLAQEVPIADAFHRYTDARSVEFPANGAPKFGRLAIRASLEGLKPGAIQWIPQGGETAQGGDMAWTWGTFTLHGPRGDEHGKYVSVWHTGPDGSWYLSADIGNTEPEVQQAK